MDHENSKKKNLTSIGGSSISLSAIHHRASGAVADEVGAGAYGSSFKQPSPSELYEPLPMIPAPSLPDGLARSRSKLGISSKISSRRSHTLRLGGTGGSMQEPMEGRPPTAGDLGQFAAQNDDGTWQFIGKSRPVRETPATRREIMDVERRFELLMSHVDKLSRQSEQGDVPGGAGSHPVLDQDFMTLQGKAEDLVRHTAAEGVKQSASRASRASRPQSRAAGKTDSGFEEVAGDLRGSQEIASQLAVALFKQKWTDLCLLELQEQLSVSCIEHARLLAALRRGAGHMFMDVQRLVAALIRTMASTEGELAIARKRLGEVQVSQERIEEQVAARYKSALEESEAAMRRVQAEADQEVADAKEQLARMSESLKTLNGVFRQMKSDDDAVRNADMRDTVQRLEAKLTERTKQVAQLEPLKDRVSSLDETVAHLEAERQSLASELAVTKEELLEKTALCQEVLQRESDRLGDAEVEKLKQREEEDEALLNTQNTPRGAAGTHRSPAVTARSRTTAGSVHDETDAITPRVRTVAVKQPDGSVIQVTSQGRELPSTMLCAGCNSRLSNAMAVVDVQDSKEEGDEDFRTPCLQFRLMLPNPAQLMLSLYPATSPTKRFNRYAETRPTRPSKPDAWVRWCMRAIVQSKQRSDSLVAQRGLGRRYRMPEFVYAWFQPCGAAALLAAHQGFIQGDEPEIESSFANSAPIWMQDIIGADINVNQKLPPMASMALKTEQDAQQQTQHADEARWALYYGVRRLAKTSAEAKLFYNFLDERYGEDEVTFFLYCTRVIEASMPGALVWGPTLYTSDYLSVPERLAQTDDAAPAPDASSTPPGDSFVVPETVWVGLNVALAAAQQILARANDEDKHLAIRRIKSRAIPAQGALYPDTGGTSNSRFGGVLVGADSEAEVVKSLTGTKHSLPAPTIGGAGAAVGSRERKCIDLFVLIRILLLEYREEQAHRRAAIRMMFDSATSAKGLRSSKSQVSVGGGQDGEAEDEAVAESGRASAQVVSAGDSGPADTDDTPAVDLRQLILIMATLNDRVDIAEAAAVYRVAYDLNPTGGVTYRAFMEAADRLQLFSQCLRLPSYVGSQKATTLLRDQRHKIAAVVHSRAQALESDLGVWLARVPRMFQGPLHELQAALQEEIKLGGSGLHVDGRRMLVTYRRLLHTLLWIRETNRQHRGESPGHLAVQAVDSELRALEGILRRDPAGLAIGRSERAMVELVTRWNEGAPEEEPVDDGLSEDRASTVSGEAEFEPEPRPVPMDFTNGVPVWMLMQFEGMDGLVSGPAQATRQSIPASQLDLILKHSDVPYGDPRLLAQSSSSITTLLRCRASVACVRVQRAFRKNSLPPEGVPACIRHLMRPNYDPKSGVTRHTARTAVMAGLHRQNSNSQGSWLTNVMGRSSADLSAASGKGKGKKPKSKGKRTLRGASRKGAPDIPALAAVLSMLSQAYLEKLQCDQLDKKAGRPLQPLPEFMYDYYLHMFGVREVAELQLHRFFAAVRQYIAHPRVRMFALFCGLLSPPEPVPSSTVAVDDLSVQDAVETALRSTRQTAVGLGLVSSPDSHSFTSRQKNSLAVLDHYTSSHEIPEPERQLLVTTELSSLEAVSFYLQVLMELSQTMAQQRKRVMNLGQGDLAAPAGRIAKSVAASGGDAAQVSSASVGSGSVASAGAMGDTVMFPTPPLTDAADPELVYHSRRGGRVHASVADGVAVRAVVTRCVSALGSDSVTNVMAQLDAAQKGSVFDVDTVLQIIMQEWASETFARQRKLSALFHAGDLDTNGVLALDEFVGIIRSVRADAPDTDAVRMFRRAAELTEIHSRARTKHRPMLENKSVAGTLSGIEPTVDQGASHLSTTSTQAAEIDIQSFLYVCRENGLSTIQLEGDYKVPSTKDPATLARLLKMTWQAYSENILADVATDKATEKRKKPGKELKGIEAERLALQQRLDHFRKLLDSTDDDLGNTADTDEVQAAWLAFRLLLSEWSKFRRLLEGSEGGA